MRKPLEFNRHGGIDLHLHSDASDGSYSPAEIVQMADRIGLQAIAITDHDTIEGSRSAQAAGMPAHIQFLTGVEISAKPPEMLHTENSMHVLGYGIDLNSRPLENSLEELRLARSQRTPQIIERLNSLGIPVSMAMIMDEVGDGTVGRPHIARAMIKEGAVSTINEAFDRYLGKGKPAYVDKFRLECRRAFELIRAAGGIPVLAHPCLIKLDRPDQLEPLLETLCDMGLQGIEAYYSQHLPEAVALYLQMAKKYHLLVTGGSDFHGDLIPEILMGSGRGGLFVPYSVYESLVGHLPS